VVCVSECDQVNTKTLYTCCEQVGRRQKDNETKHTRRYHTSTKFYRKCRYPYYLTWPLRHSEMTLHHNDENDSMFLTKYGYYRREITKYIVQTFMVQYLNVFWKLSIRITDSRLHSNWLTSLNFQQCWWYHCATDFYHPSFQKTKLSVELELCATLQTLSDSHINQTSS
jgi:hypothetical protein